AAAPAAVPRLRQRADEVTKRAGYLLLSWSQPVSSLEPSRSGMARSCISARSWRKMRRSSTRLLPRCRSAPSTFGSSRPSSGCQTFSLIVLPENREMLGLLRKIGWIHQARLAGGVYEISFELPEPA